MAVKMYELVPANGRKSFYGKAKVVVNGDGSETLYSYDSRICTRMPDGRAVRHWAGALSMTTATHVRSFCGLGRREFEALDVRD